MAGTKTGGAKARDTNLKRYGKSFYINIGRKGGLRGKESGVFKGYAVTKPVRLGWKVNQDGGKDDST